MAIAAKTGLLVGEHFHKGQPMFRSFEILEHLFLRLGHRAANAMPLAAELANIDAR